MVVLILEAAPCGKASRKGAGGFLRAETTHLSPNSFWLRGQSGLHKANITAFSRTPPEVHHLNGTHTRFSSLINTLAEYNIACPTLSVRTAACRSLINRSTMKALGITTILTLFIPQILSQSTGQGQAIIPSTLPAALSHAPTFYKPKPLARLPQTPLPGVYTACNAFVDSLLCSP